MFRYIGSGPLRNVLFNGPVILSALYPLDKFLRVEVYSDWVLLKVWPVHEINGGFDGIEVVNLTLDVVAVGVGVVHTRCRPMIHTPDREETLVSSLFVCLSQAIEALISKCDVFKSGRLGRSALGDFWVIQDSNPVVFLVISNEADLFKGIDNAPKKVNPEVYHLLVVLRRCPKNNVAQSFGAEYLVGLQARVGGEGNHFELWEGLDE
jgi:hypothetical protein